MEKKHFGPGLRWSFWPYRIGNGSKAIGGRVWWNSQRIGLEITIHVWEFQIMKDFK